MLIDTTVSRSQRAFIANSEVLLACLTHIRQIERRARERSEKPGQLPPRERLPLLLDRGAPFIDFSALAGFGLSKPDQDKSIPRCGLIAGIGQVHGTPCMDLASVTGIDASALLGKQIRTQEVALENKRPFVQLCESACANLMHPDVEKLVCGGNIFRSLERLSAAGLPVAPLMHGSSTSGGAFQAKDERAPTKEGHSDAKPCRYKPSLASTPFKSQPITKNSAARFATSSWSRLPTCRRVGPRRDPPCAPSPQALVKLHLLGLRKPPEVGGVAFFAFSKAAHQSTELPF